MENERKMKKELYTLKFVNKGKPFEIPIWTVDKHERAMAHLLQDHKTKSAAEQDSLLRSYIIYETLVEIDPDVELEKIQALHPENLVDMFNAVYLAGKKDIHFPQKSSKKK